MAQVNASSMAMGGKGNARTVERYAEAGKPRPLLGTVRCAITQFSPANLRPEPAASTWLQRDRDSSLLGAADSRDRRAHLPPLNAIPTAVNCRGWRQVRDDRDAFLCPVCTAHIEQQRRDVTSDSPIEVFPSQTFHGVDTFHGAVEGKGIQGKWPGSACTSQNGPVSGPGGEADHLEEVPAVASMLPRASPRLCHPGTDGDPRQRGRPWARLGVALGMQRC
jgi:hypothetical protein